MQRKFVKTGGRGNVVKVVDQQRRGLSTPGTSGNAEGLTTGTRGGGEHYSGKNYQEVNGPCCLAMRPKG